MNENGYCPHCGANLDGGDIMQAFIEMGKSPEEALETAKFYGYPEQKQWGRQIGFYDMRYDRTTSYSCPDCKGTWER